MEKGCIEEKSEEVGVEGVVEDAPKVAPQPLTLGDTALTRKDAIHAPAEPRTRRPLMAGLVLFVAAGFGFGFAAWTIIVPSGGAIFGGGNGGVEGIVVDTDGAAVEGVLVGVGDRAGITNASGGFIIDGIPPGKHPMTVTKYGYMPVRQMVLSVSGNRLGGVRVELKRDGTAAVADRTSGGGNFTGTVTLADGSPASSANISLDGNATIPVSADGSFMVPLPAGRHTALVQQPGTAPLTIEFFQNAGPAAPLSVRLGGASMLNLTVGTGALAGKITDEAGGPVENALVEVSTAQGGFRTLTTSSGVFEFPSLPAGEATVSVSSGGRAGTAQRFYLSGGVNGTFNASLPGAAPPGVQDTDVKDRERVYYVCGSFTVLLSLFTLLGGLFSVRRIRFPLAAWGAVAAILTFGINFMNLILGSLALILLIWSRREFR